MVHFYNIIHNEAQISKRILMDLGVADNKIFIEDKSLTTTENALFTKAILMQYGFSKPILVVSGFHLPRAVINFERAGIDVLPYPTDYRVSRTTRLYVNKFSPSYDALWNSGTALREYLGIAALRFKAQ
ncbi:YdcF family protein [Sporomusa sphaeroides]|uniref:YdcF family protein n=1 Tax=Sporomusa sphaeroides TaxID=47679 RepID=UPI002BF1478E|nr:YdcF family protein [Sporomusa sphaeroides]HML34183.1 YdcF family protein [Sporomusa sphaeroides]